MGFQKKYPDQKAAPDVTNVNTQKGKSKVVSQKIASANKMVAPINRAVKKLSEIDNNKSMSGIDKKFNTGWTLMQIDAMKDTHKKRLKLAKEQEAKDKKILDKLFKE